MGVLYRKTARMNADADVAVFEDVVANGYVVPGGAGTVEDKSLADVKVTPAVVAFNGYSADLPHVETVRMGVVDRVGQVVVVGVQGIAVVGNEVASDGVIASRDNDAVGIVAVTDVDGG